jgi:hypothetical protein
MVIKPQFKLVLGFSTGLAPVMDERSRFRYIRPDGTFAFDRWFLLGYEFEEGLAKVVDPETELGGFIDRDGEYAIEPMYGGAGSFSEGLAYVYSVLEKPELKTSDKHTDEEERTGGPSRRPKRKAVAGYIDRRGILVIRFADAKTLTRHKHGLAFVRADGRAGYIDRRGRWVWSTDESWRPIPIE